MKLNIINEVPEKLLYCLPEDVHSVLGGSTIIHLKGDNLKGSLYLSALLHGNETTSFLVLQEFFKDYKDKTLPRDVIIFIGNTLAASEGLRHLPDQPDYNRIWDGGETAEHQMAQEVLKYARENDLFASIDMHNNTGKNPFYGCINVMHDNYVQLASLFTDQIVYFTEPSEVQSLNFAKICPAVTIEAGLPGNPEGTIAVYEFVQDVLHLEKFDENFEHDHVEVYHTIARMMVDKEASIDFNFDPNSKSDISFIHDIDAKNFELLKVNTTLGFSDNIDYFKVVDNQGHDITYDMLKVKEGKIKTNRMMIPSMFTKDIYVMKEDCLGYIMEKIIPIAN